MIPTEHIFLLIDGKGLLSRHVGGLLGIIPRLPPGGIQAVYAALRDMDVILAIRMGGIAPMGGHIDGLGVILVGRALIEGRSDPFPIFGVVIGDEGGLFSTHLLCGDREEVSLEIHRLPRLKIHVFESQILGLQGRIVPYKLTIGLQ